MGCNTSRLDGLPAVALCRDRCNFIDEALRQSYAVADAHVAHMDSLKTLGPALHRFFHHFEDDSISDDSTSDSSEEAEGIYHTRYDSSPPPPHNYHPPSPPPPASSDWDFLNLFETFDKYQLPSYTHALHVKDMDNNSVSQSQKKPSESAKVKSPKAFSETMKEIHILFARASDSAIPILQMLDVGKLRYHQNIAVNPVPCKMMHVFTPSKPLTLGRRMGSGYQAVDLYKGLPLTCGNLCSTLNKLCMWEKKLYDEVKAEEKLRMLHDNKCRQLRRMNKKGADAHKVDAVETLIGILATKMKISFQVVDKISNKICELREEELWPQINSFLFRFLRMWKDMLECYRCQHKEMAEAKSLDASSFNRKLSNSDLDAAIKLKSEIQNWNLSFSDWIYAQKSHVKALNGWLVRCLVYEPEEVPDGTAPFSPGRIGAPPVFVICSKWSRAMDNLSEKDVIEAVNGFILRVNELLEKHISDLQQKLTLDKELERKVKILEKQEQKMHKVVQARERETGAIAEETDTLLTGDAVHHGELVGTISLQSGLKHIFAAMERFTASMASAYEELCQQIENDNHDYREFNNIH